MDSREIALFRYKLISPLLMDGLGRGTKKRLIEKISKQVHLHPSGKSIIVAPETLKGWVKAYRKRRKIDDLSPKVRSDKGELRVLSPVILASAIELKQELPSRSIPTVIDILERIQKVEPGILKRTTLWRHLKLAGVSKRALPPQGEFQRFQAAHPNDLWQSDEKGPFFLSLGGKSAKVRLFAFEDDSSRLLCHIQGYPQGTLLFLESTFKRAIQKRGLPRALYTDQGKVYLAHQLLRACAELDVALFHAPPYYPEGKGKIERFWLTLGSFLKEAKKTSWKDLAEFNEALEAFVELRYNRELHSEIHAIPLERYLSEPALIRRPEEEKLRAAFLWKEPRKIRKDKTFRHAGKFWSVESFSWRDKVEIRYDPEHPEEVEVWREGRRIERARPLDPTPQVPRKKARESSTPLSRSREYLKKIVQDHRQVQEAEILGPRFSVGGLIEILEREEIRLSPSEKRSVREAFERFGPFDPDLSQRALAGVVRARGKRRHIREYLDAIVETHQRRKP